MKCSLCMTEGEVPICVNCISKMVKLHLITGIPFDKTQRQTRFMNVIEQVQTEMTRQVELHGVQSYPFATESEKMTARTNLPRVRSECDSAIENSIGSWKKIAEEEFLEAQAEDEFTLIIKETIETIAVLCSAILDIMEKNLPKIEIDEIGEELLQ